MTFLRDGTHCTSTLTLYLSRCDNNSSVYPIRKWMVVTEGNGHTAPHRITLLCLLLIITSLSHTLYHVPSINFLMNWSSITVSMGCLKGSRRLPKLAHTFMWITRPLLQYAVWSLTRVPCIPGLCDTQLVWRLGLVICQRVITLWCDLIETSFPSGSGRGNASIHREKFLKQRKSYIIITDIT